MVAKRQRVQQRLKLIPFTSPEVVPEATAAVATPASEAQPSSAGQQRQGSHLSKSEIRAPTGGGLYIISVAARLLEMHPQTLRKYERVGLISPPRTVGMLRLYSSQDITRLRLIKYLVEDLGINLAGVEFVLDMFARLHQIRDRVTALEEAQPVKDMMAKELETLLELLNKAFDGLLEQ